MIFMYRLSIYIPDSVKSDAWLLWDRKYTWTNCKVVYVDFERAYDALRLHDHTHALLQSMRFKA